MKKIVALALILFVGVSAAFAQHEKNDKPKSPHETVKGKDMSITYGRPYKKGRDIFGGLVPYGEVWRTGADEATVITLDRPAMIGGKKVDKGSYALFTIPNKDKWTIILNKKSNQWGAFKYDEYKSQDALHVDVPAHTANDATEQFTIMTDNNGFTMKWDKTEVKVPVKLM